MDERFLEAEGGCWVLGEVEGASTAIEGKPLKYWLFLGSATTAGCMMALYDE